METHLAHHGILGMKWGVRRYQNYDGSYTQAGLKRYSQSMDSYQKSDARYRSLKKDRTASKADIANAKLGRKQAKNRLNKDYNHLKQDKLADQGKKIYANGRTITDNGVKARSLATTGFLATASAPYVFEMTGSVAVSDALRAIGTMSSATALGLYGINAYEAKRLRAYYAHTSKY